MLTSSVEMLELPNLGQMTILSIKFEPRNKTLLVISWGETTIDT